MMQKVRTAMGDQEIQTYRDLDAWNVAMDLVVESYELAAKLPSIERYELSSQIRRAATSVPSNVAEGQASGRSGLFLRHVSIALGSLGELDTHFEIGRRLGFLPDKEVALIREHVGRTRQLLYGLRRSLLKQQLKRICSSLAILVGPALWLVSPFLG